MTRRTSLKESKSVGDNAETAVGARLLAPQSTHWAAADQSKDDCERINQNSGGANEPQEPRARRVRPPDLDEIGDDGDFAQCHGCKIEELADPAELLRGRELLRSEIAHVGAGAIADGDGQDDLGGNGDQLDGGQVSIQVGEGDRTALTQVHKASQKSMRMTPLTQREE